jgi:uncharacterized iron-regulated membrane protein
VNLPLRKVIFWIHLISGLLAGVIIAIMSLTGAMLAFEKELVIWSERDARKVAVPADTTQRISVDAAIERVKTVVPDARPSTVVLSSNPEDAMAVALGRDRTYYVNPYTGEVKQPKSTRVHDWLHVAEDWHRYLGREGESRPTGKLINGASNLVFFGLAVTGLYIWWPRGGNWRQLKPAIWFVRGAKGKTRDWNWHNVIGFWTAPVLIVLTLTALPISFRWASNGIYRLWGETPPVQQGPGAAPAVTVPTPPEGSRRLPLHRLVETVTAQSPTWETITLRLAAPGRGGQQPQTPASGQAAAPGSNGASAPAANISVRETGAWPLFATTQYALDPFTGNVLRKDTYEDATAGRKTRMWTRFLHTGEALGFFGKLIAGLASLGGVVLVYTGFALSCRRFFGKKPRPEPTATREIARQSS